MALNIGFNNKFANVVLLGVAFMLLFTAFQTCAGVQKIVLESSSIADKGQAGYISLATIYIVFAIANWIAPSVITITGQKFALIIGGAVYCGFIATFLYPSVYLLYPGSVLLGIAAAVIWTAQGSYLTINSDSDTISRNSGVFWALLQCSLIFGNLFVFYEFKGEETIPDSTRFTLFAVLLVVSCCGLACLFTLKDRRTQDSGGDSLITIQSETGTDSGNSVSPLDALKRSFELLKTREMLLLSVCFAYTGFELTFFSGVYGTSIGHTLQLGADSAKQLLGLSGVFIGAGEILGGGLFGLAGERTNKFGRDPIVLLGFLLHMAAFFLIFLIIPPDAPIKDSLDYSYWHPSKYMALFCSFLLGFGDSSFNTQIYSILGYMFPEDSAPAFALFKFVQSFAAAIGFFYSDYLVLHWQLLILVIWGIVGSLSFFLVEWKNRVRTESGYSQIKG